MPIGTSKLGVLGAGVVPGGTETFNTSGTFKVPPGVSKVSITGKGATGNPGNAGNAGNAGNPGTGGAGGGAAKGQYGPSPYGQFNPVDGFTAGGLAFKTVFPYFVIPSPYQLYNNINNSNCYAIGGWAQRPSVGIAGQSGVAGQAGQAGTAGNPGNAGQASNGICKTFSGGAGGNAGAAGNAGTAGNAGSGGGGGGASGGGGGSGGTGGGNGGNGGNFVRIGCSSCNRILGAVGGGGAGSVNSGQSGANMNRASQQTPVAQLTAPRFVVGGSGNVTAPINPGFPWLVCNPAASTSTMGGGMRYSPGCGTCGTPVFAINAQSARLEPGNVPATRRSFSQISPAPLAPDVLRSGGGGSGNYVSIVCCAPGSNQYIGGGAGGGGGRGNAGNAGGNSTAPSGSAATPQTFNCVSVTPGSSYPITIGSPGGQIVISWNPQ